MDAIVICYSWYKSIICCYTLFMYFWKGKLLVVKFLKWLPSHMPVVLLQLWRNKCTWRGRGGNLVPCPCFEAVAWKRWKPEAWLLINAISLLEVFWECKWNSQWKNKYIMLMAWVTLLLIRDWFLAHSFVFSSYKSQELFLQMRLIFWYQIRMEALLCSGLHWFHMCPLQFLNSS